MADTFVIPFGSRSTGNAPVPFLPDTITRTVVGQGRRYALDVVVTDSRGTLVNGRTFPLTRDAVNALTNRW